MKRIRCLGWYQKGILLLMAVMVLAFAVIYAVTIAREGFAYEDAILVPKQENGNTVYSGKIQGEQASFTVYADKTVEFRYGDKLYGPYAVREDPSAIPDADEEGQPLGGESVTGVEPVSYTHLDVYKRQILCFGITENPFFPVFLL